MNQYGQINYMINVDETTDMYYIHSDYLDSILVLLSESEPLVEKYYYDAWGRRMNPAYRSLPDTPPEKPLSLQLRKTITTDSYRVRVLFPFTIKNHTKR